MGQGLFQCLGGEEERRVAARGLANVAGFLRGELGRRLHLRSAPQLRFEFDDSMERGQRIETLLREWHAEADQRPAAAAEEPPADDAAGNAGEPGEEERSG